MSRRAVGPPFGGLAVRRLPCDEPSAPDGTAGPGGPSGAGTAADPDVVVIATGSEVAVAVGAALLPAGEGIRARVVSMPCREWFDAQPAAYRDRVIPPAVRRRIAVEAGVGQSWYDLVGLDGRTIGVEDFGASASAADLFTDFGITPEAVAKTARDLLR
ncbi:putative transketolase [Actinacidiphila reveromycinica]|uniref:transketolase n=1 Tax=Actinacidiphila reveromycinica TaxID=659352 RepID=A0A7U3UYH7_9ACTN|nr:putative transketolase [Streptomyces sp. SN-593]